MLSALKSIGLFIWEAFFFTFSMAAILLAVFFLFEG